MNLNRLASLLNHILALVAFLLLFLGILEWVANALGYTLVHQAYRAGRLLELAAIFAIFVATLLLRQLREEIRKGSRPS